jgi:hypothetical protein
MISVGLEVPTPILTKQVPRAYGRAFQNRTENNGKLIFTTFYFQNNER